MQSRPKTAEPTSKLPSSTLVFLWGAVQVAVLVILLLFALPGSGHAAQCQDGQVGAATADGVRVCVR